MDVRLLLVEFSRELDEAEAPVIQAEALFRQQEAVIFQAEAPVDCPKPWDLGVRGARTFSKLYLRAFPRIMRGHAREEKRVQIFGEW